jgi:hypothetical protein
MGNLKVAFKDFDWNSLCKSRKVFKITPYVLPDRYNSIRILGAGPSLFDSCSEVFEMNDGSRRTVTTSSDSSMRVRNVANNIALHHACLSVTRVSVSRYFSCR